uniref:Zgc:66426 n=1 Tax=Salarias fasciatus TaxID=181472 RepID=A0A672GQS8_SALFA
MDRKLSPEELQDLFAWIDKIPLLGPKKREGIANDFSDGVMAARVVKQFFPELVDLHNYIPAISIKEKVKNWTLLNRKVFSKLGFLLLESTIRKIALNTVGAVMPVLRILREKIETKLEHSSDNTLVGTACMPVIKPELDSSTEPKEMMKNSTDAYPAFKHIPEEEKQTVETLQETVEKLQIKVSLLEGLLHLKDNAMEDLMRYLEEYKARLTDQQLM